ncbi:APC membrane recruitment protein 2-like [Denticeps clupeoides]|uniref:APC membrane recruitment protein 2-like n=1 Tax=Denticeps clupeoides TaxID=299321 RepID=UPI0010A45228|nr:APC membrane recruitment protein 2-like [Denticeps clupeoides]
MDVQSESCEPPPSDPQAPGKIRKAFKLFGKGKPGSSVASIFSRRSKGEGAPKSTFSRSKTLEGLSESMAAPQDAQEAATVSEPATLLQQEVERSMDQAQVEPPTVAEVSVEQVSPARPSISSITSAKSLNFLSLLRKTRRGTGGGDRQVHTESQRGGRQRKGLKGLFGSIRWRRRDEEHDEDGPPPLTASRSNSVEIIKEDLTLTPRPPQRADAERDQECQQETPNVGGANEAKAATMATSQLTASSADPPSDRLSTLLADISSILSFDSLTGCGDIVADVEAEWVKASNRVGAAAAAAASAGGDESNSGDKSSSSATPISTSARLSPNPAPTETNKCPVSADPSPKTEPPQTKLIPHASPMTDAPTALASGTKPPVTSAPVAPVPKATSGPPAKPTALQVSTTKSAAKTMTTVKSTQKTKPPPKIITTIRLPPPPTKPPATTETKSLTPPAKVTGTPTTSPDAAKVVTVETLLESTAKAAPEISQTSVASSPKPCPVPSIQSTPYPGTTMPPPATSPTQPFATPLPPAVAAYKPPPAYGSTPAPAPAIAPCQTPSAPSKPASITPPTATLTPPVLAPQASPAASPPCSKPPFTTPAAAPPPSAKHPPASTSTQPPPSTCPVPSPVPVEKEAQEDGGEDLASREGIDEKDMGGQWSKPQLKDEPQSAVIDQDSQGEKKSPVVKPTALSKIPICGGARPGKQARESQPNGEEVPWSLPTPGPEEDGMRPLSQDASSKDPFGECVPQPTATTPTTSQEENKFSPPAQTSSRLPSKGTTAGPRDSKIPIKQGAHSAPIYHSIQGKADATRTKIPVSKVPVRRSVSKPVEAVTTASARK